VSHRVRIEQLDREILVDGNATILSAALDAGLDYPFMCQQGQCGSCKSFLLEGRVELGNFYNPMVLTPAERERGFILACQAHPLSDCIVAIGEIGGLVSHPVRNLNCVVRERTKVAHDIFRIRLDTLRGGPLIFSAGQYAALTFAGLPPRDFSMANRPDETTLEFHIQHFPGGRASDHVATTLAVGDPVALRGPYGAAYLREEHLGPILLAAGGTGLAPILSILETALAMGLRQRFHLYFGVRRESDLYCETRLRALAARHRNLSFVPALSEPEGETARRRGNVSDVIAADFADFSAFHAYIAGPPAHCEATRRVLLARGLPEDACFADPFVTATDR
jgi:naphthalene 1,2-dioxygenase ferredoxin reductase component